MVYGIQYIFIVRGRRGHNVMIVGITTTYAVSTYYHSMQHYVIKFVSLLQVSVFFLSGYSCFPHRYNWNIAENGIKHDNPNPALYCLILCIRLFLNFKEVGSLSKYQVV